jgi:hypothetical protein
MVLVMLLLVSGFVLWFVGLMIGAYAVSSVAFTVATVFALVSGVAVLLSLCWFVVKL